MKNKVNKEGYKFIKRNASIIQDAFAMQTPQNGCRPHKSRSRRSYGEAKKKSKSPGFVATGNAGDGVFCVQCHKKKTSGAKL